MGACFGLALLRANLEIEEYRRRRDARRQAEFDAAYAAATPHEQRMMLLKRQIEVLEESNKELSRKLDSLSRNIGESNYRSGEMNPSGPW